jgi:hypothetical protein
MGLPIAIEKIFHLFDEPKQPEIRWTCTRQLEDGSCSILNFYSTEHQQCTQPNIPYKRLDCPENERVG